MGWDLAIVNTGNGGDFTMKGKSDLHVTLNDENEIFLRLFGGNIEQDTKSTRQAGDEDKSFWANNMLFGDSKIQFNSLTERTLRETEVSSAGRQRIENAIKKDLDGLTVTVFVSIVGPDKWGVQIDHILDNGAQRQVKFSHSKNSNAGDFDLSDFSVIDFN